jgi:competence protein ComEA
MFKTYLSSVFFALLTSVSVAVTAAPATKAVDAPPPAPSTAIAAQTAKVNINVANADTLQSELSGIGAGKAAAIVAYRDENGSFTSVDELIEVKGIGKALLDKNRDKVAID